MAIQSGVIQYSGKLGQTVGMSGQNGKHYMRVRRDTIKNPRSAGQAIQRMIASTVAVSISYLTEILNNSVEGKTNGAQTLNYLRSIWMNMLRTADASQTPSTYLYLPKGKKIFVPNRYLLSQGRLAAPTFTVDESATLVLQAAVGNNTPGEGTASEIFPDVRVGDQITVIIVSGLGLDYTEAQYCRFAFKNDTTPVLIEDGTTWVLNPAAIDLAKAAGKWAELTFGIYDGQLQINAEALSISSVNDNGQCFGAGVIVSNIENKQRSTSYFVSSGVEALADYLCGGDVYPSYMGSSTDIDLASEIYLNNSARRNAGAAAVELNSNAPLVINEDGTANIHVSDFDSMPQSLYVHILANGTDVTPNVNIIGAAVDTVVWDGGEDGTLEVNAAAALAGTTLNFSLAANGVGIAIVGGHGVLADGTPFTF